MSVLLESALDTAMSLMTGDFLSSSNAVLPHVAPTTQIVPYTGNTSAGPLGTLYEVIGKAMGMGEGFKSVYSALTGSNFEGDIARFFNNNPNDDTLFTTEVFTACDKLTDDIKKALTQAHATLNPQIPTTCMGGSCWKCDETFVKDRQNEIKKLQDEIDNLICQMQGKRLQQEQHELSLASCTAKLNASNSACLAKNGTTSASGSCGCTATTTQAVNSCGCQAPAPVTNSCGCNTCQAPVIQTPTVTFATEEIKTCPLAEKPKRKRRRKMILKNEPWHTEDMYWDPAVYPDYYAEYDDFLIPKW